jgi:hypothetical protein
MFRRPSKNYIKGKFLPYLSRLT